MCSTITMTPVECERKAQDALSHSKYAPVRRLNCRFDQGQLRITGYVSSFFHKQLAHSAIVEAGIPCQVDNAVVVDV